MGPKKVKSGNGSVSKKPKRITVEINKEIITKHENRHHIPPPPSTYASNYISTAKWEILIWVINRVSEWIKFVARGSTAYKIHFSNFQSKSVWLHGLYSLSYMWYSALNSVVVIFVGLLVSLITGPMKKRDITPGTVYPLLDNMHFFLQILLKPKLCCGSPPEHRQITTHCEQMNGAAQPEKNTGTEEERETFLPLGQRSSLEQETSV